uniref:Melanoma cell adhesion molecule n=1 Tax=Dromaius novaehollandiae TaxID=8790 RepID=A0A8C4JWT3_DRONO
MPPVVEVAFGDTARIECNFSIPGNGSYTSINWSYMDRHGRVKLCSVVGDELLEESADYKGRLSVGKDHALSIGRVTVQDARTIVCQVGAGSHGTGENRTELRVYKIPEAPEITASRGGISVLSRDIPQIASCVSRNSILPPNITWHKNGEQLQAEENKVKIQETVTRESSWLYTVSSSLFAYVTREDRDSRYHCTVHYWLRGQRRAMESARVNVTVFYPTQHVALQVLPSPALVKEGDDVKLVCEADGNPAPVFSFYKRELEDNWQDLTSLADTTSGVLNLQDVKKSSSGLYRCQTLDLDDMKQMEDDVELVVNCKSGGLGPCTSHDGSPSPPAYCTPISIPPLDIEGVSVKMEPSSPVGEGDSVRLSCNADSPVALDFQWRDAKGRKVAEGKQLLLSNLTFETSSNFSCKVTAHSVPGLEKSKQVAVPVEGSRVRGESAHRQQPDSARGPQPAASRSPVQGHQRAGHQREAHPAARSQDAGEQRRDHRRHHRLHPLGGRAGVCHLLLAQERQDPVWPCWETGHVSTASPREPALGPEALVIAHASHLIASAAPCPRGWEAAGQHLGGHRAGVSAALGASRSLGVRTAPHFHAGR